MFYERNSSDETGKVFLPPVRRTETNTPAKGEISFFSTAQAYSTSPRAVLDRRPTQSLRRHLATAPASGAERTEVPAVRSRKETSLPPSATSEVKSGFYNHHHQAKANGINRPLQVLIADDNLLIRTSLFNLFEKWGANCVVCENGEAAWNKLQEEHFDLVLIDLQMPYMDGHEVVASLRADEDSINQLVPIVAMAGSTDESAREQILSAGACTCMSKPLDPQQLFKIVAERTLLPAHRQVTLYTDVIDYAALKRMYESDTAHLDNMLSIFLRNTPTALQVMESAIQQEDWHQLEREVHKIRPTFAMVGLQRISEVAEELETILTKQTEKIYDNIYTDFNRFRVAIRQSLKIVAEQREAMQDYLK